jgi:hypothetical protein
MAAKINHLSHGMGDAIIGHHIPGNVARDGAPKRVTGIEVAHGQRSRSGGADILSGSPKRLTVTGSALGEAMLAEAFAASAADDCQAHGRNKDGSKC